MDEVTGNSRNLIINFSLLIINFKLEHLAMEWKLPP